MSAHHPAGRELVFCATGITRTVGGIAAANRNVLAALEEVGSATRRPVRTLVLNETGPGTTGRTFGGDKARFALAVLAAAPRCGLMVFDHVRLALPLLALPRAWRPATAICAHGSESWRRVRPASLRAFRAADLVLANSNYTLARMRERFDGFKGVACPLGLAPEVAMAPAPPPWLDEAVGMVAADGTARLLGARVLLIVSRLDAGEREKGHRELIGAFARVATLFQGAQLVIAGGGTDLEALRALAAQSPAAGAIFLPGYVADDLRERLYRKAFAYVMPSRQEGFGLAYLEAMNHAKPCLACRDDGGADVVAEGETGVLVSRDFSSDELVAAISDLLGDPRRARRLGEAGWLRLTQSFSSQAHQQRMVDLFKPLVETS